MAESPAPLGTMGGELASFKSNLSGPFLSSAMGTVMFQNTAISDGISSFTGKLDAIVNISSGMSPFQTSPSNGITPAAVGMESKESSWGLGR